MRRVDPAPVRHLRILPLLFLLPLALSPGFAVEPSWQGESDPAEPLTATAEDPAVIEKRNRAIALYDAGDYSAALPLLQELAGDETSGAILYRLYYCQSEAGSPDARASMLVARAALEAEVASATDLETPFYLANVYRNGGKLSAAGEVAGKATSQVEAGTIPEPTNGIGAFQLGKLYADQKNEAKAVEWYQRAVTALAEEGLGKSPARQWAARYLADHASASGDPAAALEYLTMMGDGQTTVADLDRVARHEISRGNYASAAEAWFAAVRKAPATGDQFRYAAQITVQAAELDLDEPTAPDGRLWADLAPAELEQLMLDNATLGRAKLAEAEAIAELDRATRKRLQDEISPAHRTFVAAAIEYILRGLPIRETSFRAGYAPLMFHSNRWRIPFRRRTGGGGAGKKSGAPGTDGSDGGG